MKKNGFTLINLLAVTIILGLVAATSIWGVNRVLTHDKHIEENNAKQTSEIQIDLIKAAAKNYVMNEEIEWTGSDSGIATYDLTLGDLQNKGYIDQKIIDPATDKVLESNITIKVTKDTNNKMTFEVSDLE